MATTTDEYDMLPKSEVEYPNEAPDFFISQV